VECRNDQFTGEQSLVDHLKAIRFVIPLNGTHQNFPAGTDRKRRPQGASALTAIV
jgi:hypothetical protein